MADTNILNLQTLWLPILTAWTGLGGLPGTPKIIQDLAKNEWFRWFTMFLLVLQSFGAAGNPQIALISTIIVFLLIKLFDGAYFARECPVPVPVTTGA